MIRIAGIGSRGLNADQLEHCRILGKYIATLGMELHSGNAEGADQAFQNGAASVNPSLVHPHLPWDRYNKEALIKGMRWDSLDQLPESTHRYYEELAAKQHPVWKNLSGGARRLHTRNGRIIVPIYPVPHTKVDLILAWPSNKVGQGGTGMGMRMGKGLGIQVVDLSQLKSREDFRKLCDQISELREHHG